MYLASKEQTGLTASPTVSARGAVKAHWLIDGERGGAALGKSA